MFCVAYPGYRTRLEFMVDPYKAEVIRSHSEYPVAVAWIMGATKSDSVFVATDALALHVVGPSGRKVVAVDRYFSNPFLDWTTRDRYRRRLFELAGSSNERDFIRLANLLDVSYLISQDDDQRALRAAPFLGIAFCQKNLCIYSIRLWKETAVDSMGWIMNRRGIEQLADAFLPQVAVAIEEKALRQRGCQRNIKG
jgi:hypothetical protein